MIRGRWWILNWLGVVFRFKKPILKALGVALVCYVLIRLLQVSVWGGEHQTRLESTYSQLPVQNVVGSSPADLFSCDKVIHVASVVLGHVAAREWSITLKTLVHTRRVGLQLYLVTDKQAHTILKTLLDTWEIPYLSALFIRSETLVPDDISRSQKNVILQKSLASILPRPTEKVIYLSYDVRIASDIQHLWDHFEHFNSKQLIGSLPIHKFYSTKVFNGSKISLLLIAKMREVLPDLTSFKYVSSTQQRRLMEKYSRLMSSIEHYELPCSWGVINNKHFEHHKCLGTNPVHAYVLADGSGTASDLRQSSSLYQSVLNQDGEAYRSQNLACPPHPPPNNPYPQEDQCRQYRHAADIKRRTHLFYIRSITEPKPRNDVHVTLVTIMTLDRFVTFERLVSQWQGAVVAVFHATDADTQHLDDKLAQSSILSATNDLSLHIVYKRGDYFPINYLRNVGLGAVTSPYTLFVDVDLVPTPGISRILEGYIRMYLQAQKGINLALVIPAFEAYNNFTYATFPRNKTDFINLWDDKKVNGYKMNRKWNLGHKPTDYKRWRTAVEPYLAKWKDAFEPYVVIPTSMSPMYRETLLERMGDKIAYGRDLHARGFQFLVLPDLFLIHMPHNTSDGTKLWMTKSNYLRCGGKLFNEFREALRSEYPHVKF